MLRHTIFALALVGCGNSPGHDPVDAAPAKLEPGRYSMAWQCLEGCLAPMPLTPFRWFQMTGDIVAMGRSECSGEPECTRAGTIVPNGDDCYSIDGITWDGAQELEIWICNLDGEVQHTGYPGPFGTIKRWRFTLTRE